MPPILKAAVPTLIISAFPAEKGEMISGANRANSEPLTVQKIVDQRIASLMAERRRSNFFAP